MNVIDATALLERIHEQKQAGWFEDAKAKAQALTGSTLDWMKAKLPVIGGGADPLIEAVAGGTRVRTPASLSANARLQAEAKSEIVQTILLTIGGGAALRGVPALWDAVTKTPEVEDPMSVELPILMPRRKKVADDLDVTAKPSLSYYLSGHLLGGVAGAYGGWKGLDLIMEAQRKKELAEDTEKSKQRYEDALLGMYKRSTDLALEQAFRGYKKAEMTLADLNPLTLPSRLLSMVAPNAGGMATGAINAFALGSLPIGYMLVRDRLKRLNNKRLLADAMELRAITRDRQQPLPLYAVPEEQADN